MTTDEPNPPERQGDRGSGKAATIYDVAKHAGVSHITVSRYLHGFEGMRPATRERVQAAIELLGYRPNLAARSLVTNRPHQIAALVHELAGSGPGKVIEAASHEARAAGYVLDIITLDPLDDGVIADAIKLLSRQHVGGILATAPTKPVRDALAGLEIDRPLVIATTPDLDPDAEVREGPYAVMEHLIALGHRRIAHIAGPGEWVGAEERVAAYTHTMGEAGLGPVTIERGDWSPASGYAAVERLLERAPETTAVFCANDRMALGAVKRLHELGFRVPDEMSVAGYDDQAEAAYFEPSLTTCRQDLVALGQTAARRLIALIEGREPEAEVQSRPHLVVRDSTARPRPGTLPPAPAG